MPHLNPPSQTGRLTLLLAALLAFGATAQPARATVLDFEGVPGDYNYDGLGMNLGSYYVSLPGGPVFGPQNTVLEVGGSLNDALYPPNSGTAVLWGEGGAIGVRFTTSPVSSIGLYYRSNTDLYLYAFDSDDNLIGSTSGAFSLGPDPGAFLTYDAGNDLIAYAVIQDSGNFFVIDDLTYGRVPDAGGTLLLGSLAVGTLAFARRRLA